jgi:hypothetical protein
VITADALAASLADHPYHLPKAEIERLRPHLEAEAERINAIMASDPRFEVPLGEGDVSLAE